MNEYTAFASVYDEFMDNIPYDDWSVYIESLLKEYGVNDGLVLDLGCGTGVITEILASHGYDMIGVDASSEMLMEAQEKKASSGLDILYLNQDMREFELYGTVAGAVSICDCMNYITEYEDLVTVFKLVNNYLDPKGVFIFDMNTEYKYQQIGDLTIAEDREDKSFIWENYYDDENRINVYELSIFIKGDDDRYDKYKEQHFQKAYTLDEVKRAIDEAGMEFVASYDAFTKNAPSNESERIYVIAREKGK